MRIHRKLAILALVILACRPEPDQGGTAKDLVNESGSLVCGARERVYTNHGAQAKELHVKVSQNCDERDSTIHFTTIQVTDREGRVDSSQLTTINGNLTHRGTFSVPGGSTLEIICGRPSGPGTCNWEYKYALKP